MLFASLQASPALSLERYADIDHFRESERYVRAESIPLAAGTFSVLRASLQFPASVLSLVRTFPRIIKGYEMPGRLVVVIPMDNVASTKVNGEEAGSDTLILFKGSADCTIHEPEGRLVAILSVRTDLVDSRWQDFGDGHLLLRLQPFQLVHIQGMVRHMLEFAAREPAFILAQGALHRMQGLLFDTLDVAMCAGRIQSGGHRKTLARYKEILDRIDVMLSTDPTRDPTSEELAGEIGVSARTLQTAARAVSGLGIHHYSRLMRLWSVRRQLRTGAAGLTVKASALAHGFWHMGEFSGVYRATFGEPPSETLARSKHVTSDGRLLARH
ncbi:MAG: helix-turn-helix domain-containing protein [Bradyrhizobium sp.]